MSTELKKDLIEVAKVCGTTSYGDIAPIENLNMSNPEDRNILSERLRYISEEEHEDGRPLLSAVVKNKKTGMPGPDFFTLAHELGLYDGGSKKTFFQSELNRVHEYWKNNNH